MMLITVIGQDQVKIALKTLCFYNYMSLSNTSKHAVCAGISVTLKIKGIFFAPNHSAHGVRM